MNQFGTKRICGRDDALSFLNATRPNVDGECPENYQRCADVTDPENTICSLDGEDCPITDVIFVETSKVKSFTD